MHCISTGYIYENGLSEVMVGLAMSLGGLTGVLGSYAFTWFRWRIGLERTGLIAFNLELVCLTLCVASIWAPGSVFEPTSLFQPRHTDYPQNCSLVQSVGNASDLQAYRNMGSDVTAQGCGETAMSKEKISIALFLVGIITSRVGESVFIGIITICSHFTIFSSACVHIVWSIYYDISTDLH